MSGFSGFSGSNLARLRFQQPGLIGFDWICIGFHAGNIPKNPIFKLSAIRPWKIPAFLIIPSDLVRKVSLIISTPNLY